MLQFVSFVLSCNPYLFNIYMYTTFSLIQDPPKFSFSKQFRINFNDVRFLRLSHCAPV